jgi:hypothetical protein
LKAVIILPLYNTTNMRRSRGVIVDNMRNLGKAQKCIVWGVGGFICEDAGSTEKLTEYRPGRMLVLTNSGTNAKEASRGS